jgi:predicted lysophospholipase L1 biosynthesis ABC-type transport system permease subunit
MMAVFAVVSRSKMPMIRTRLVSLKNAMNAEIFERNVGQASPLKLNRGLNATWSKGGLMYAIPFK